MTAKRKPKACRICKEPGADGHTCSMESYLRNNPDFAAELEERERQREIDERKVKP